MFDIGFQEMALVFIIALVVLGPEKLPGLARSLGQWTGRARSYVRHLSSELDREVAAQETREQLARLKHDLDGATRLVSQEAQPDAQPPKDSDHRE